MVEGKETEIEIEELREEIKKIQENEIPHIKGRISELESKMDSLPHSEELVSELKAFDYGGTRRDIAKEQWETFMEVGSLGGGVIVGTIILGIVRGYLPTNLGVAALVFFLALTSSFLWSRFR